YDDLKLSNPSPEITKRAIPEVLRQLHAKQASALAKQGWTTNTGETLYLIDDPELRFFYGDTIGQIAHSHWWSVSKVEKELIEDLGAFPARTRSRIDRIKLACLLRVADALHLDQRRAPRFLRALTNPTGISAQHWNFQERLAVPHVEHEAVVFTSAMPFTAADADSWWLAFDTINAVNRELQDVDLLLQSRAPGLFFRARRVKGAGSPEALARTVTTQGWRPIDTRLQVSDIPKIVETLGGAKLYGDDPTVVLREMIQNSADAVQARRRYQKRPEGWGNITVALREKSDGFWLTIEDNGIGMSERVLTGPLIDFGTSFWRSSLATQEFPGLVSRGMNAIGRYGIGFFSVFMIGTVVRVFSRRYDKGEDDARMLEFRDGTAARPILSPVEAGISPVDGGTRVEIRLKVPPLEKGGLLNSRGQDEPKVTLKQLVASLAPNIAVAIDVIENDLPVQAVIPGDWLRLQDEELLHRLEPESVYQTNSRKPGHSAIRTLLDENGRPLGRAYIKAGDSYFNSEAGWITIGGLRAGRLSN
ncbi:MAG: ATP-binding protein, partial [Alcaligenaceae bacterium]